jgi:hypothetical protein
MGLDAFVFCDCYEKGRLKRKPHEPELVCVLPNGDLGCRSKDSKLLERFDRWRENACKHEAGMITGDYLGNESLIGSIRDELRRKPRKFPTLLNRVIYSGTHCGDHLTLRMVAKLQLELERLKAHHSSNKQLDREIQKLRRKLQKLVRASLKIGKPIGF